MKKMLLIINPNAGKKQGMHFLPDILTVFSETGYITTVLLTHQSGEATKYAQQYGAGMDLIVCIGGDGTFNEVSAGVMKLERQVPIGYIPAGSTNDFAASLHIPLQPVAAARAIVAGTPCTLDMGCFNSRYFSYVASFGAFTKTSYSTPQNLKNSLGHIAYLLEGIKDLSSLKGYNLTVKTDVETFEGEYLFGAISNATSIGGILKYPEALVSMNDGELEMLLIRFPVTLLDVNDILQALAVGNYTNSEHILFTTARQFTITAPSDMEWSLDGERQEGSTDILVQNVHQAIQLML